MKKPLKVLSNASLATIFAVSAITPVAAATVKENVEFKAIQEIILEVDGKVVSVDYEDYKVAKRGKIQWAVNAKIEYIKTSEDEVYSFEDFKAAKRASKGDPEKAIEILKQQNLQLTPEYLEGKIDDNGDLVIIDEQPEDRLNETFFYNFAA